ncbi:unnamed protein product, partial [Polarella glacialis]
MAAQSKVLAYWTYAKFRERLAEMRACCGAYWPGSGNPLQDPWMETSIADLRHRSALEAVAAAARAAPQPEESMPVASPKGLTLPQAAHLPGVISSSSIVPAPSPDTQDGRQRSTSTGSRPGRQRPTAAAQPAQAPLQRSAAGRPSSSGSSASCGNGGCLRTLGNDPRRIVPGLPAGPGTSPSSKTGTAAPDAAAGYTALLPAPFEKELERLRREKEQQSDELRKLRDDLTHSERERRLQAELIHSLRSQLEDKDELVSTLRELATSGRSAAPRSNGSSLPLLEEPFLDLAATRREVFPVIPDVLHELPVPEDVNLRSSASAAQLSASAATLPPAQMETQLPQIERYQRQPESAEVAAQAWNGGILGSYAPVRRRLAEAVGRAAVSPFQVLAEALADDDTSSNLAGATASDGTGLLLDEQNSQVLAGMVVSACLDGVQKTCLRAQARGWLQLGSDWPLQNSLLYQRQQVLLMRAALVLPVSPGTSFVGSVLGVSASSPRRLSRLAVPAALEAAGAEEAEEDGKLLSELLELGSDGGPALESSVEEHFANISPEDLSELHRKAQVEGQEGSAARAVAEAIQASVQKRMVAAKEVIQELLYTKAGDVNLLIRKTLKAQDSPLPILMVLQANMADAQAEGDTGKTQVLMHIHTVMNEELEKKVPRVKSLLSKLLRIEDVSIRNNLLRHHLTPVEVAAAPMLDDDGPGDLKAALVPPNRFAAAITQLVNDVDRQIVAVVGKEDESRFETLDRIRQA